MQPLCNYTSALVSALSIVIAVALLASFGLHAIQVTHEHPGATSYTPVMDKHGHVHGSEPVVPSSDLVFLGEYMHLADKKLLLLVAALGLLTLTLPPSISTYTRLLSWRDRIVRQCRRYIDTQPHVLYNYLAQALSKGIMHTKVY